MRIIKAGCRKLCLLQDAPCDLIGAATGGNGNPGDAHAIRNPLPDLVCIAAQHGGFEFGREV